ncbi:hypothetical protein LCGC14_3155740, partial [marine sediment metagenome]
MKPYKPNPRHHEHDWMQGRRRGNVLSLKCRDCPAVQFRPDIKPSDVGYPAALAM